MAPTGRAAKVISTYSGATGIYTIHIEKFTFLKKQSGGASDSLYWPPTNIGTPLFIVDEASMIPDAPCGF